MKEKIKIFLFLILVGFFLTEGVFAVSGACSHHGGVNCVAGRQLNGRVICNNGWTDSMAEYDFMVVCQNYKFSCNTTEWNNLSQKYGLEELFFKMQRITDTVPFNQSFYNLYKSQYDQSYILAERECFAIGADRAFQNNFERMQLEFYGNQIQSSQEEIKQLEKEKQRIEEWYQTELKKLEQSACPKNSKISEGLCICNEGYVWNGKTCITYNQNCQSKYGLNSYGDKQHCYCFVGYKFNSSKTTCIKTEASEEEIIRPIQEQQTQQHQEEKEERPVAILGDEKEISDEIQEVFDSETKEETQELEELQEQEGRKEKQGKLTFIKSIFNAIGNFFSRVLNWF